MVNAALTSAAGNCLRQIPDLFFKIEIPSLRRRPFEPRALGFGPPPLDIEVVNEKRTCAPEQTVYGRSIGGLGGGGEVRAVRPNAAKAGSRIGLEGRVR